MIKIKLVTVIALIPILQKLVKVSGEDPNFKFETSLKLRRLLKALSPELDDFNAERQKLIDKFTIPKLEDDGTGNLVPTGELIVKDPEKFNMYMRQLLDLDIELYSVSLFKYEDFNGAKGISVTDLTDMESIIEPEEVPADVQPRKKQINLILDKED